MKRDYIPEISEIRMARRAPERPFPLSTEDADYIETRVRDVEAAFGLNAFPNLAFAQIPGRALIERLIHWWRALEPEDEQQREAHGRLPGAIRLLDTHSSLMEERATRQASHIL